MTREGGSLRTSLYETFESLQSEQIWTSLEMTGFLAMDFSRTLPLEVLTPFETTRNQLL